MKTKRRRRRRRHRKTSKEIEQHVKYARRFRIAKGDRRFKVPKGMVRCTRLSKAKKRKGKTRRIYYRKKCRKNEITLSH